ncbi:hypothetical protein OPQ81_010405 [Rhizoctonia solani]|nr:hypothetical protein OPQ81_010405 [Rhizoctonia solani]
MDVNAPAREWSADMGSASPGSPPPSGNQSRKRISIACTYCRKSNNNTTTIDQQAPVSLDISKRLEQLEAAVHASVSASTSASRPHRPSEDSPSAGSAQLVESPGGRRPLASAGGPTAASGQRLDHDLLAILGDGLVDDTMSIPTLHSTTSASLLQTPPFRLLLGEYPRDVFYRIEARRGVPDDLKLEMRRPLHAGAFTQLIHPFHPVLDLAAIVPSVESAVAAGLAPDATSAHALAVLALGAIASERPLQHNLYNNSGIAFIGPALQILLQQWAACFTPDITPARALYLAALYYSYLAMPLQSWRLVHMASTTVQHLWIHDIMAEYHLPRSGIEHVIDRMPFPSCGSDDTIMLNWLANLSSRRLLNRVHHAMYGRLGVLESGASINAGQQNKGPADERSHRENNPKPLLKVADELSRQLSTWYNTLPASIKPLTDSLLPSTDEVIILLRYHATGDIICRPFLLLICSLPADSEVQHEVYDKALACLYHCQQYLRQVGRRIETASASLEVVLHSTLSCILLVTAAALSPLLTRHVENLSLLQDNAVAYLKKWASPGSSIEGMLQVLLAARDKSRLLLA